MKPSQEPKADKLINSNMPQGDTGVDPNAPDPTADQPDPAVDALNGDLAASEAEIDAALAGG
jgi:hypothetical protein